MGYLPIEDYGVIGDCHTTALVGLNGSIDWLCFPHFDSPSLFGAILDDQKGGSFRIYPLDEELKTKQMYLPDTNVLVTRFLKSDGGIAEVTDFMPVEDDQKETWNHRVVRMVQVIHGTFHFRMTCQPAFNYARSKHSIEQYPQGVVFRSGDLNVGLSSQEPIKSKENTAVSEFTLEEGQRTTFVLHRVENGEPCGKMNNHQEIDEVYHYTVSFWRQWLSKCTYTGRWREIVHRSALMLKLLTFAPTGAMIAAPTLGLPETIGGERNWDYRYTWIRDASFTCYALLRLGFETEAGRFMEWLEQRCYANGLQIVYRLDGGTELPEETLDHLSGYRNSGPVRIGNNAYKQLQLDVYGELMDAVYLYNKHAQPISYSLWSKLRTLMDWLCQNWQKPDQGLWEVQTEPQPFVYSRMMTWVAFDRALRIARQRGLPAPRQKWEELSDIIYEEVMKKGWNEKLQSFVQYYGSDNLDASNLLMSLVKFVGPTDQKMLATLDRTIEKLTYDTLVYRYLPCQGAKDGLKGEEGAFSICSFWLVECLTRAGRLDEARLKLEKMFSYANHLGLYSEQIGKSGEMLGNYPQAFTHLSLISATFNLDRALNSAR